MMKMFNKASTFNRLPFMTNMLTGPTSLLFTSQTSMRYFAAFDRLQSQ